MGFKTKKIPRDLLLDPPPQRRRRWLPLLLLLAAIGLLLVTIDLKASQPDEAGSGQLVFKGETAWQQAVHLETSIDVRITGIVTQTVLKQSFRNDSDSWQEAIYVFPLDETAAVTEMEMKIGDRIIRSQIRERHEAQRIYAEAKQQGKKAALTEQQRPNLFTQSVANIPPRETIDVTLKYVQAVDYDNGLFSLRLPLTLTPRYMPGRTSAEAFAVNPLGWATPTDQVPDAQRISPYMHPQSDSATVNPVTIHIELNAGLPLAGISSPYHKISIAKEQNHHEVTLTHGSVSMDRDFVLEWRPVTGTEPQAAVFTEVIGDNDYALIMIVPPGTQADYRIPRDMTFVVDTSGSMEGTSIVQARASLHAALEKLKPEDRFNIIQFHSLYSRLFNDSRPADYQYLAEAREWIDDLSAGGGTEMFEPLQAALTAKPKEGYLRQIVFITDGAVGNEDRLFALIHQNLGNARLFTVGIGSAPNSFFMRKSAQFGRGSYTHIGTTAEVGERMNALYRKIETPLVDDIDIRWHGSAGVEYFPRRIPTLYQGEPLIVTARGLPLTGEVEITGATGAARWSRRVTLPASTTGAGIGTLWARQKITDLMDEKVLGKDVRAEVTKVALEHHLVTAYTSLVAVEEFISRAPGTDTQTTPVPNAIAKGQVVSEVMFPRTATRARLSLVIGLLLLALAAIMYLRQRSCSIGA